MKTNSLCSIDYEELLLQAVAVLDRARTNIARSITCHVNNTYWELGKMLYVKKFYLRFHNSDSKLLQAVAVLPWGHILKLITDSSTKNNDEAILYYVNEAIQKGWSRELLTNAIKLKMYESKRHSVQDNNFEATLPASQALYANEVLKSSYNLGFLGATSPLLEIELEQRLVEKVKLFLLELGNGFTYIGNQYPIEYKGSIGIIDLLFFHRGLKCLIAIELKSGKYKPEYAGKMNYYLSILDRTERGEGENPSIGIILCAEKNHVDVELSLDGFEKPIGVADYRLVIPKKELKKLVQTELKKYNQER